MAKSEKIDLSETVDWDKFLGSKGIGPQKPDNLEEEMMKNEIVQALYRKAVDKGDHNAAFRIAQIKGWIVEKKEEKLTLELSADDRAKRLLQAERELGAGELPEGRRVDKVPKKPPLLHDNLRLDSGQSTSKKD